MNDTTQLDLHPEVTSFVAAVRKHLADLTEEERDELVGGLEADLTERLHDGETDLGDPAAYAAELRAASGLEERPRRRVRGPHPATLMAELDNARDRWNRLTVARPELARAWELARALRPAWWALRAWLAVQLLDLAVGPSEYLTFLPSLGDQLIGCLVLLAAVLISVLIGSGRLWPGTSPRSLANRLILLALNVFAVVVALPSVLNAFPNAWDSHQMANGGIYREARTAHAPGLMSDGHYIRNVFAYDADGKPLTGVQLFDQKGRPLTVTEDPYRSSYGAVEHRVLTYPWFNGERKLFNVYPLPVREQNGLRRLADAWGSSRPPALPSAPLAVVPPVALPTPPPAEPATAPTPEQGRGPEPGPAADSEKQPAR